STTLSLTTIHRPPTPTLFPYTTLFRSETNRGGKVNRPVYRRSDEEASVDGEQMTFTVVWEDIASDVLAELWIRAQDRQAVADSRSEEHTSELQSRFDLVCRLLLEKKKK